VSNASRPLSHHETLSLDTGTLASVRPGAKVIHDCVAGGALPPICARILNAAIQYNQGQTFTNDGLESNFGVDYLSNILLVLLLLRSMGKESGCVVIISSLTHNHPDTQNSHIKDSHKIIFKDVNLLAKPLIEDTRAGK
jgi:NAD(P)-dependent dehydrogenase (short-subunit alcohol dehydrogenase family)